MRFTVRCRQCPSYTRTFEDQSEVARWLGQDGHDDHPDHQRFVIYCDFKPLYEEVRAAKVRFGEGDEYIFITRSGRDDLVLACGPDGRAALFDRFSPLTHELAEGLRVRGEIVKIGETWIIVKPLEIIGPASILDAGLPELVREAKRGPIHLEE